MENNKPLPRYNVTINPEARTSDEELGIDMIAFTDSPAIMVKGMAYKATEKVQHFSDKVKMRITAPAMIPMDIYRRDEDGEYEVSFSEEVIDEMHNKFMRNLNNKDLFNLEHNENQKVPAYILEAWIVDKPKEDKAYSTFGIEVPKGTLMVTAQVTDKEYYRSLVENEQFAFSIEGFLALTIANEEELNSQLNKYSMNIPEGATLTIDGKDYVMKDGEFSEVEVKAEEEKVELAEEVVEEAMEDVSEEEEVVVEAEVEAEDKPVVEEEQMEVNPEADSEAILAIVAPYLDEKINEVLQVIADMKNEMADAEEEAPEAEVETQMSASHKFSSLVKFLQNG